MASLEAGNEGTTSPLLKPCVTCRRRKIRCDKTRPCSNCTRTNQLCMYDGDIPAIGIDKQSIEAASSSDSEVRDRLARLEKLMEAVIAGKNGRVAMGAGVGFGIPVAQDALSDLAQPPTTSSPSQSFHTNTAPLIETANAPIGQILFKELHSAYFDSNFWAGLIPEIEDLRRLFDPPSAHESPSWISNSTLGMSPLPATDLSSDHPTLEESHLLCKLFFESVNPFIRVLHQAHFGRELDRYRRGSIDTPREFEALLSAIYLLTINSLRPEVIQTAFSSSKDTLLSRYQHACRSALANVQFFKTDKIHTMQALIHYLTFLFEQNLYQDANALLGIVSRLAQTMGFHRDPSHFPFSPWVCEIRRRIWNHLCCLDAMALSLHGAESCLPSTSDARSPQNADDIDWHASRFANPSSVPSNSGFTDMTFALVHRVIADKTRCLARVDPLDFEKKETILRQTESILNENYFVGIDRNNPSHTMVAAFAEMRITSLRLCHRYRQAQRASSQSSDPGRQPYFLAAIELLEGFEYHAKTFAPFKWEWVFETIIPWLAIAIVLTGLPRATRPSDIDRAQRQIDHNFHRFSDPSNPVSATPMWKILVQLRQQMQEPPSQSSLSQSNVTRASGQPLQDSATLALTDNLMLDFGVSAAGTDSLMYEDQFILQDVQDLPWLNTQIPY